ncbi:HIRAN domain-containing protein [Niabella terrae]
MNRKKEHLAHFDIAGFTYYDGPQAFNNLRIGTQLQLSYDRKNEYDPRAIMISFKNYKLGYVPRTENRILFKLISVGLGRHLESRIQRVSVDSHPEHQIQVVVHLLGS